MSVFHLKSGGTKTGGSASTPGDWSNANCYGTWPNVMAAIAAGADGDSVIVNDEIFPIATNASASLNINGTIYIQSKSGDADIAGLKSSVATGALLLSNSTTHSCKVVWQGLTLGKSVAHTDTARPVIHHMAQRTGDVTFDDCIFDGIDINIATGATWYFGLVTNDSAAGYGTKIRFNRPTFSNFNCQFAANGVLFAYTTGSPKVIEVNNPTIRNIVANNLIGGFVTTQGAKLRFWDVDLDGWTTTADAGKLCGGLFKHVQHAAGAKMVGRRIKLKNATMTADVADTLIDATCPYDIKNLLGIGVHANSATKTAGQGAIFMAINATAQGILRGVRAFDCHANYGAAAYWSNGAGGIASDIWAEQCSVGTGVLYKGGGGDVHLSNAVVKDCVQRDSADETNLITEAMACYWHIHATTGDHDAKVGMKDVICIDNHALTGKPDVMFNNPNATYTLNGRAERVTVRGNTHGILMEGNAVNLIVVDCNLDGGSAAIEQSQLSGTLTESGTMDADIYVSRGVSAATVLADSWTRV